MRRAVLLFVLLLLAPGGLAQDYPFDKDDSTPAYEKALELWKKGRWASAQAAFRKMLDEFPDSVHRPEAEDRSDDNCYLGTTVLHESGPSDRRIDVAVMGDGFTIDPRDQALEQKWAKLCVDVLFNEASFREYQDYFNIYFVRLASLEEGVDPALSDAERAKIEERNRRRVRKKKTEFDTALDCKAAGPQGQVMADPGLVYGWLAVADEDRKGCGDDGLVIAFARFGVLGMGGGGIANVGRPDKSITVHEFGHAFTGLLDEYTGNPNPPGWKIRAANATSDRDDIPWQHFLDAHVKGVDVIEGGATYNKGVWRPAPSCAMNAAGATQFCPVCREANVLAIYAFVDPIDAAGPDPAAPVQILEGDDLTLSVTPMRPRTHQLEVEWFTAPLPEATTSDRPAVPRKDPEDDWWRKRLNGGRGSVIGFTGGGRARQSRDQYDDPPAGEPSRLGDVDRGRRGEPTRHVFPAGRLSPGRWSVTAVVRDRTPWVLKDEHHLLEERRTWQVTVLPKK